MMTTSTICSTSKEPPVFYAETDKLALWFANASGTNHWAPTVILSASIIVINVRLVILHSFRVITYSYKLVFKPYEQWIFSKAQR